MVLSPSEKQKFQSRRRLHFAKLWYSNAAPVQKRGWAQLSARTA